MNRFINWISNGFRKLHPDAYSHIHIDDTQPNQLLKQSTFYFLGKRILPSGILPSSAALSHMQKKTVRPLSVQKREQGATKKFIGLYWLKWICWAVPLIASFPAWAVVSGASCPAVEDDASTEPAAGRDSVARMRFDRTGNCTTDDSFSLRASSLTASTSFPLRLFLNSNNDGAPEVLDSFAITYHSTVTAVSLDGSSYASGTQISLTTAQSFSQILKFTFGGVDLQFTVSKAAGTDTLGTFTVIAQTSDGTNTPEPDPEPTSDVADPVILDSNDNSSLTVSFSPADGASGHIVACSTSETITAPSDGSVIASDTACADGVGYQEASTSATWDNLAENTAYYFKIFPYSNSGSDIDYKTDSATLLKGVAGSSYVPSNAGAFGGEKVTPTTYKVTVSKIEFKNSQGEYVTFAEEGSRFDIASVAANSSVGTFAKTATLPNDSYSEIRVTFANTFGLRFSGSDKGTACRSDSGGATGTVNSTLTNVAMGSRDGSEAAEQEIAYPSGSTAEAVLSSAGMTNTGGSFQVTKAVSFTVTDNSIPPSIGINFDAADSVEVLNSAGTCFVIPQAPSVNVTVGG